MKFRDKRGTALNISGGDASTKFDLVISPRQPIILSAGSTTTANAKAAHVTQHTAATTRSFSDISVRLKPGSQPRGLPQITSSNPGVCDYNQSGVATPASAGSTDVSVFIPGLGTKIATVPVVDSGGQMATTFLNWISGSYELYASTAIETMVGAKPSPGYGPVFQIPPWPWMASSQIFNQSRSTRNSSIWAISNLGGIPVSSDHNGTLVASDTMIFSPHYGHSATVSFVGDDGIIYTSATSSGYDLSTNYGMPLDGGGDIRVVRLLTPMPSMVKPFKVVPSTWRNYFTSPQYGGIPCCWTDQYTTLSIGALKDIPAKDPATLLNFGKHPDSELGYWGYSAWTFGSGSGIFAIDGAGQLNFVAPVRFGQGGPPIGDWLTEIRAGMSALGCVGSLVEGDYSSFTSY